MSTDMRVVPGDLLADVLDTALANLKAVHGEFCGSTGCDCKQQADKISRLSLAAEMSGVEWER